jgi:nitroreductase
MFDVTSRVRSMAKWVVPRRILRVARGLLGRKRPLDVFAAKLAAYRALMRASSDQEDLSCQLYSLRKIAHALDKGLHHAQWEPGHGLRLYERLQTLLRSVGHVPDPTVAWAQNIATEFQRRRECGQKRPTPLGAQVTPPPIDADGLLGLFRARTSSRAYSDRCVRECDIRAIVQAALQAPSSSSRQTLRVYATVTPETARTIASRFHGYTCFSVHLPALILFCVDLRPYTYPQELFIPTLDTGLAVENAALMATSLGMSMTQLIWVGERGPQEAIRAAWDIPDWEEIVVGATCGYPCRQAIRPVRKSVESALVMK